MKTESPNIVEVKSGAFSLLVTQRTSGDDENEGAWLKGGSTHVTINSVIAIGSFGSGNWIDGQRAKECIDNACAVVCFTFVVKFNA